LATVAGANTRIRLGDLAVIIFNMIKLFEINTLLH